MINRVVAVAIEVEFEPRPVRDDMLRHAANGFARERILLAQPVAVAERHSRRDLGPQIVPVVDRRRDHRPRPVLDSPPAFHIDRSLIHSAESAWRNFRLRIQQLEQFNAVSERAAEWPQ